MIRKLFCIAVLGMQAACASTGLHAPQSASSDATLAAGSGAGTGVGGGAGVCNDDTVQSLVGSMFTQALAEQARVRSGSSVLQSSRGRS